MGEKRNRDLRREEWIRLEIWIVRLQNFKATQTWHSIETRQFSNIAEFANLLAFRIIRVICHVTNLSSTNSLSIVFR